MANHLVILILPAVICEEILSKIYFWSGNLYSFHNPNLTELKRYQNKYSAVLLPHYMCVWLPLTKLLINHASPQQRKIDFNHVHQITTGVQPSYPTTDHGLQFPMIIALKECMAF